MSELQKCKFVGGPANGSETLVDVRLQTVVRSGFNNRLFLYERRTLVDKSGERFEYHHGDSIKIKLKGLR